jgi:trehalose 6-phosphate synthase
VDGLKRALLAAIRAEPADLQRRMRAMRRRVADYDVGRWAENFLTALRNDEAGEVPEEADLLA